jgi:hypothetical protein
MSKVKVFWFSRHPMTIEQHSALVNRCGEVEVTQVNGTAANVHVPFSAEVNGAAAQDVKPLKEWVSEFDIIAVVAPIGLLQQILSVSGEKPVISALNQRVLVGGEKFDFVFQKWERMVRVDIVKEDF